MFGSFNAARYAKEKAQAETLPRRAVARDEFVRLAVAAGTTQQEAEFQAKICESLGSETRVGDEMLSITNESL